MEELVLDWSFYPYSVCFRAGIVAKAYRLRKAARDLMK